MRENTRASSKIGSFCKTLFLFCVKYIGILFGMGVLGLLFMILAYALPVNETIKESSLSHAAQMGWAPLVNNRYTQYESYFCTYEPGILDDTTDKIILNNVFDESKGTLLERAVSVQNYGRYWHGYISILRPLFFFVDYWDFLLINSFLQLFLMGVTGYGVLKVTANKKYALAFFCSCIFLTPSATAASLQYTPVFYISMLGSLVCLLKTEYILQKNRRYYLFLFLGIATCYFDFLTYPLLSYAFPFCWLITAAGSRLDRKAQLKLLFGSGLSFLFGYGGFFVMKWVIHAVTLGGNIFQDGLSRVFLYINDLEDSYKMLHQHYTRIDTLYNNFRHYLFPVFIIILSVWMGIFVYRFMRGNLKFQAESTIFAAVTLMGPAWYYIVNTHTAAHHLFTYRIYDASLLGFMLFVCSVTGEKNPTGHKRASYLKRSLVLGLCLILGYFASKLAKEDLMSISAGENTELLLSEGDALEVEFTPSIEAIKSFSFCYHTRDSLSGEIILEVYDGDALKAEYTVPIETFQNSVNNMLLTDWRLTPGRQYRLKVSVRDNESGIYILMTPEGIRPQPEYGQSYLNQEPLGDVEPLSFIRYRGHVQTRLVKLFLSFCAGTFLLMWFRIFCSEGSQLAFSVLRNRNRKNAS